MHDFFSLCFGRIEFMIDFYLLYFLLNSFAERKTFVVDEIMHSCIITQRGIELLNGIDGRRCQFFIVDEITRYSTVTQSGYLCQYFLEFVETFVFSGVYCYNGNTEIGFQSTDIDLDTFLEAISFMVSAITTGIFRSII